MCDNCFDFQIACDDNCPTSIYQDIWNDTPSKIYINRKTVHYTNKTQDVNFSFCQLAFNCIWSIFFYIFWRWKWNCVLIVQLQCIQFHNRFRIMWTCHALTKCPCLINLIRKKDVKVFFPSGYPMVRRIIQHWERGNLACVMVH